MEEIQVLGVNLKERTTREGLSLAETFLGDGILDVIYFVTMENLLHASEQEEMKAWLESLDLTVSVDADIPKAAGIDDKNRLWEIEHHSFLREFVRRLARDRVPVYLLSGNEKEMRALEEGLQNLRWNLLIAGSAVISAAVPDREKAAGDAGGTAEMDRLINDINNVAPRVIISNFPFCGDREVIQYARPFINAEAWLQIPHRSLETGQESISRGFLIRLHKKIARHLFHRQVSSYRKDK